jgi:hypothetical protein
MSRDPANLPRARRHRHPLERAWPWAIAGVVLAVGVLFGGIAWLKHLQSTEGAEGTGAFTLITVLGIVTVLLIGTTFFYTLRKRTRPLQEHLPGSMMTWLKSHIYLGFVALVAALGHAVTRPLTTNLTTGKLTFLVLLVLVLSGIAWRIVYLVVPARVAREVGHLSLSDTNERVEEIRVEMDKLAAGRGPAFHQAVADRLAGRRPPADLDREMASQDVGDQEAWRRIQELAGERQRLLATAARQRRFGRLLQGWKLVHLPLVAVLLGLIVVHILDVFGVGRTLFGGQGKDFPASAACGNCHTEIVEQWHRGVMSHAQTSPVMIAQTALALQKNPGFGQVCVNCHAPIGAALTGATTLPLAGDSTDPIVNTEGVTCVVCHALERAPPKLSGASGDFPIVPADRSSLGRLAGPPLEDPPGIPVPDHEIFTGFMTDSRSSSELCGACHVVKVDLNEDGRFDKDEDLILQTTFEEWKRDYLPKLGDAALSCVDCHAPPSQGPLVRFGPGGIALPNRTIHNHAFVGVDYDITPGHPGLSDEDFALALEEREDLLRTAATLEVNARQQFVGLLNATVRIRNVGNGHDLPTGFAFVRQMWLEVTAKTASGDAVCLAPIEAEGGLRIETPDCGSGILESDQDDLKPCDTVALGLANSDIRLTKPSPLDDCDPWLTNFQKILTDGDPDGDGEFLEVPYQSLLPAIVKLAVRVVDQQPMAPIKAGEVSRFDYAFAVEEEVGEDVTVEAVLRFRHLSPYFLRGLDGFFPEGMDSNALVENLFTVDMARATSEPVTIQD